MTSTRAPDVIPIELVTCTLPPAVQYDLASLPDCRGAVYQLAAEEEADLIEADAEIARGELASDVEVEAVFAKYRI